MLERGWPQELGIGLLKGAPGTDSRYVMSCTLAAPAREEPGPLHGKWWEPGCLGKCSVPALPDPVPGLHRTLHPSLSLWRGLSSPASGGLASTACLAQQLSGSEQEWKAMCACVCMKGQRPEPDV